MFDPSKYDPDRELTTNQCSEVAKMNRRTIVAWIHSGDLPATQLPGKRGHYRILWKDLKTVLTKPATPKE